MENQHSHTQSDVENRTCRNYYQPGLFFLFILFLQIGGMDILIQWFSLPYRGELLVSQLMIALPSAWVLMSRRHRKKNKRGRKLWSDFGSIVILVLITIAIMPVSSWINRLSLLVFHNAIRESVVQITEQTSLGQMVFLMAILPAIGEEMAFRGVIFCGYRKNEGFWKGAILSSLAFGLMHANFNQFSYAFFIGMLFCVILEVTEMLGSVMIIHGLFNAMSAAITYQMSGSKENLAMAPVAEHETIATVLGDFPIVCICMLVIMAGIICMAKLQGADEKLKAMFQRKAKDNRSKQLPERRVIADRIAFFVACGFLIFSAVAYELQKMAIINLG